MSRCAGAVLVLTLAGGLGAAPAGAQSLGPNTGGLGGLDQALRFLGHTRRVLMIGAHPDDEDTELLTVLARGYGAEAAYLALTRGEGGQNLIGSELGPSLGVLRTEELLAARALDGARQYFSRAYDFGFSKSLTDTWRFWPRDSVLKDVVRVIRRFQPQIVVAVFSGTPRDGHGQHQASGWAAREAYDAAGDPARFPELLREEGLAPWRPLKLYQSARFDPGGAALTLEGGVIDRAVGQSYLQIAMRGRSLHRSQDMGAPQRLGPSTVRVRLVDDRTGAGEPSLFAGLDTSLSAIVPGPVPAATRGRLDSLGSALERLTPWDAAALPDLRSALRSLLGDSTTWSPAARDQLRRIDVAGALASQVLCDATSPRDEVVPGDGVAVEVACWNASAAPVTVRPKVTGPGGIAGASEMMRLAPGQLAADTIRLTVPPGAPATEPYYLRSPVHGAMYDWRPEDRAVWSEPFQPPPFVASFTLGNGVPIEREVVHRFMDQALGEVRRPVFLVPAVEVQLVPRTGLWPLRAAAPHEFTVRLTSHVNTATAGTVRLSLPTGWSPVPARPFTLAASGSASITFAVRPPTAAAEGRFTLQATATTGDGRVFGAGVQRVSYPHIRTRQLTAPAEAAVALGRLEVAGLGRIGYVRGAADGVPEVLRTLGIPVVLLPADSLAKADLAGFRTIVIGPRAYETEPAVLAANDRLLAFVRNGGTLLVQYQQQAYFRGGFAPNGLSLSVPGETGGRPPISRVAEEDASVTVLVPSHPAFTTPHRITGADWEGWIQERGLYFPRSWGAGWTPLLAMADAGEPPQQGGLLITTVGRGTYVYTGLSFFRELPAAVPGAARLFVNLLALGR